MTYRESRTLELYPFQRDGVKWLTGRNGILGDIMGHGKTPQAVMADRGEKTLVVCKHIARSKWKKEFQTWIDEHDVQILEKPEHVNTGARIMIVNYEHIGIKQSKNTKLWSCNTDLGASIFSARFDRIIFDDPSKYLTNRKNQAFEGAKWLCHKRNKGCTVHILNGTSFRKKVMDIWTLLHLCDPKKYSSFWNFAKVHASARPPAMGEFSWQYTDFPTDYQKLVDSIKDVYLRRENEVELPAVTTRDIWLDMEPEQERMQRELLEEGLTLSDEDSLVVTQNALVLQTRLRQLSISPRLLGSKSVGPKLEYLGEVLAQRNKVLIFSAYEKPLDLVNELYGPFPKFAGDVKNMDELQHDFQTNPNTKAALMTISKAESIDLYAADTIVFLDREWVPGDNEQALFRVLRIGLDHPVLVLNLKLTGGFADELIYDKLDYRIANIAEINRLAIQEFKKRLKERACQR